MVGWQAGFIAVRKFKDTIFCKTCIKNHSSAVGWMEPDAASRRMLPKLKPPSKKAAFFVEQRILISSIQKMVSALKILEIILI